MKRGIVDTHCHVYDGEFGHDIGQVIDSAVKAGVGTLLLPNINPDTVPAMLDVCSRWPGLCRPMIGLHPEDLSDDYHGQLDMLKGLLDADMSDPALHRYVGIGETGLDLHWDASRLDDQIDSFRQQIGWAIEYDLPVVIHCRDAHDTLVKVLEPYSGLGLRGVFHCFAGGCSEALDLLGFDGFMFGIGGVLTYKKSLLPESVPVIPKDRIVVETDCPYLPPVPYRGKRNEPAYIVRTLEFLAGIWNCSLEQAIDITAANAGRLFRL